MKTQDPSTIRIAGLLAAAALLCATPTRAQQEGAVPPAIDAMARAVAAELQMHCPLAKANDTAAFDRCRAGLYGDSVLRAHLPKIVLWGRQSSNVHATLRQTNLTQFAPDTWTHLYAPLFMFNGKYKVEWVPEEKQYLVRLEAAFRNRLAPGQFPYPFWHEAAKWNTYQNANGFLLWVHPHTARIQVAQFTSRAANPMLQAVVPVEHKFDGQWLWTDTGGRTQPAVTLFDGLYRADNPYLRPLDRQYRDLALQMRDAQCNKCHVPDNPDKMSRLVLLSTPAHAAGEIERLIKSVREDKMPMDEFRNSYALPDQDKQWLLQSAEAFRDTVRAARDWETQAGRRESPTGWQPVGAAPQSTGAAQ